MPLIDLRSNLRALRYGSDRFGGGNSGQPYIQTPIPEYTDPNVPSSPDFLLRNGYLSPLATGQDLVRIGKFFSDPNGKGALFIAKENLLARQNPKSIGGPDNFYLPTNTLAQIGVAGISGHLPLLGAAPFLPLQSKYEYQQQENHNSDKTNRLVLLKDLKLSKTADVTSGDISLFGISNLDNQVLKYMGGPGSFLGLTNTVIGRDTSRRGNTADKAQSNEAVGFTYKQLEQSIPLGEKGETSLISIEDYRQKINATNRSMPFSDYKTFNREKTFGIGSPGARYKLVTSTVDALSATPIFSSSVAPDFANKPELNDIIKFYISVVNNDDPTESDFIFFRAYIDSFSDNFSAAWNPYKFVGRGEDFYTYNGFSRSINLSFKIFVQSIQERKAIYQKLNYLQSTLAPDYSTAGIARGNILRLTVGDYVTDLYGVLETLTCEIPTDSNWDIGRDAQGKLDGLQLPQLINVTGFSFKPIHNFLPRRVRGGDFNGAPFISAVQGSTYSKL
jgi:hypothetical protein